MTDAHYAVCAIGNAIVDVLAQVDDDFIETHGLNRGTMTLIDAERAEALYAAMPPAEEHSGGSAGNTAAGVAALGGSAAFIGKVKKDDLGKIFTHDIRAQGVTFDTEPGLIGDPTARSFIMVTPDAARTMNTYLGACQMLSPPDVPKAMIEASAVTYMEGYLWDPPAAKRAFIKAMDIAKAAGRRASLTLSDPFCVERYRDEFLDLVDNKIDILFANEAELKALYQTDDFETALSTLRGRVEVAAVTRSEKGSIILRGEETVEVPAAPVADIIDTTGAGDLYAAGFLHGFTQGLALDRCGWLGALCAAEIISHLGARPHADLKELAADIIA